MIVWTTQPYGAVGQLEKAGVFRCAPEKSFNLSKPDSLKRSYRWLAARMRERIGPPPGGVEYPVWAWAVWNFERRCPDADSAAFLSRGEDKALFTLDVPEDQLVLTDFDAWQNVMMGAYVPGDITEAEFDAVQARIDALEGEALDAFVETSWVNVFNTAPCDTPELVRGRYVQATFWEIKAEWVRDVKLLPANA